MSKDKAVHHPPHYLQGGLECIDVIKAMLTAEEFKGYCKVMPLNTFGEKIIKVQTFKI
jgi:hypothetical protein